MAERNPKQQGLKLESRRTKNCTEASFDAKSKTTRIETRGCVWFAVFCVGFDAKSRTTRIETRSCPLPLASNSKFQFQFQFQTLTFTFVPLWPKNLVATRSQKSQITKIGTNPNYELLTSVLRGRRWMGTVEDNCSTLPRKCRSSQSGSGRVELLIDDGNELLESVIMALNEALPLLEIPGWTVWIELSTSLQAPKSLRE